MADQPLVNADRAVIEEEKLVDYALNPDHVLGRHKARVFARALGFDGSNWRLLRSAILSELPQSPATRSSETPFGTKYEVRVTVTGPRGRTADVVTIWQYDKQGDGTQSEAPRLVTLYLP